MSTTSAHAATEIANVKGAACLVSDESGRVLVTKDILNNLIAIPGGYVDSDNPADAAIRETREETGIDVKVVGELARPRNAVLYDCVALAPIPVHTGTNGEATVAAWKAEHFGREVRAVYMMKPDEDMLENARFPDQVAMFPELLKSSSKSPLDEQDNFSYLAHDFSVWNAGVNQQLQNAVSALPQTISGFVGSVLTTSSALGSGALFFLLLPIAIATGGIRRASEVLLVTVVATVIVSFGKLYFGVPRPFHIFPELQLAEASGFAFPSGNTATAFAVWGLLYHWLKQAGHDRITLWLVPSLLVALSRVYLGVHYVTDVLAGAVIGALIVFIVTSLNRRQWRDKPLLVHPAFWFIVGILTLPFAATQIQPLFLYCAVFSLIYAAMLLGNRVAITRDSGMGLKAGILTLFVIFAITGMAFWGGQVSNSSIEILAMNCLAVAFLAMWIGRGACLATR
ncbi:bifunctional NUDIX hydrolase/phosphatase PAP2 family protein [Enterovibrio coralii]|uniref:bifunctional NUDIX hydrolase/phosphatase PAP2 family protein n=1 Tax=Enterovibrio coralii TaxID=294935 RepID=UPI001E64F372|nr:phosphatase PAP2 family protein [Enterovibrio coralii]